MLLAQWLERNPAEAFASTIELIEGMAAAAGEPQPLKITAALTDGVSLHALRYASDQKPPTLYIRKPEHGAGTLLVSEPLDEARDGWQPVPAQSHVTVTRRATIVTPFRSAASVPALV
jgi:glutamine amidotransferase